MSAQEQGPQPERPVRAQLELLIRAEDGGSFELRRVPSSVAYLGSRPQRVAADQWELAQLPPGLQRTSSYVLKNRRTEDYLLLTEPEKFLWEQMDGRASVQDIGTAYLLRFGSFDFDVLRTLIVKLQRARLLTMEPASRLRQVLARNRRNPAARAAEAMLHALERLTVTSRESHDVFQRIYQCGGFLLFSPFAVAALAVMGVLGVRAAAGLWAHTGEITAALARHPLVAILLVKVVFWLTVVGHQIIHALACVHYGRRVREFGFTMLHGFIPTFYVDVTDIFMTGRRARIVNALAGPLVHFFLACLCLWTASLARPGLLQGFLAASAILQLQSFFVSLYPFCFLEMDGYHILVDALSTPHLNHEAMDFVRGELWRRLARGRGLTRQEAVYVAYFALSLVSVVGFVGLNVWVLTAGVRS